MNVHMCRNVVKEQVSKRHINALMSDPLDLPFCLHHDPHCTWLPRDNTRLCRVLTRTAPSMSNACLSTTIGTASSTERAIANTRGLLNIKSLDQNVDVERDTINILYTAQEITETSASYMYIG